MASNVAPYEFETVNPVDFKLKISYEIQGIIFSQLFTKAIEKMQENGTVKIGEKVDEGSLPDTFKVDKRYLKLVEMGCKSNIKQIIRDVAKDEIKVSSIKVVDAEFERKDNKYHVNCFFEGIYRDEHKE